MDTINSYLDNMFLGLPINSNTQRAKEELLAMMEDKYHELKAEGKTENEAIGIVISEFGNLDEVSDVLGINQEVTTQQTDVRTIDLTQVKQYLDDVKSITPKLAFGTMLPILSPVMILMAMAFHYFSDSLDETRAAMVGLILLISVVAIGVYFIVRANQDLSEYEVYKSDQIHLDYTAKQFLQNERVQIQKNYRNKLSLSVALYILSVIPLFITIAWIGHEEYGYILFAVSALLVIVALSTYNWMVADGPNTAVKVLLQQDEYHPSNKHKLAKYEKITNVYWAIVLAIFLIWSFVGSAWGRSWIIWPIAGVIYWVVEAVIE